MTIADLKPKQRVAYVHFDGEREYGTVSSVNHLYAFVRFDAQVAKLGWDGATSQVVRSLRFGGGMNCPVCQQPLRKVPLNSDTNQNPFYLARYLFIWGVPPTLNGEGTLQQYLCENGHEFFERWEKADNRG